MEKESYTDFNLQTDRPVCMSFTLEGRGENYVKLSMRWCRGWTHPQERQPKEGKAIFFTLEGRNKNVKRVMRRGRGTIAARLKRWVRLMGQESVYVRLTTAPLSGVTASRCKPTGEYFDVVDAVDAGQEDDLLIMASCCVYMVDGMMAGSTTGVPMPPGYGGCQTATPPPYYTT
ncbi:hypothetical protein DAPPUDRAFT_109952 [Daphnia pulex]|uniref:Uncharacterized protein n=1 Tax=Daphnia pulex TaxID=6669 RepID=E9H4Q1_DAPPU|nr:hypothetical protein DAPPUDRAFT_109952 [Daphnia pulex]|eukprot:EFX73316.1 hypothetical protein DAPPUDRAFT_109952 [Daphnia pulex]